MSISNEVLTSESTFEQWRHNPGKDRTATGELTNSQFEVHKRQADQYHENRERYEESSTAILKAVVRETPDGSKSNYIIIRNIN